MVRLPIFKAMSYTRVQFRWGTNLLITTFFVREILFIFSNVLLLYWLAKFIFKLFFTVDTHPRQLLTKYRLECWKSICFNFYRAFNPASVWTYVWVIVVLCYSQVSTKLRTSHNCVIFSFIQHIFIRTSILKASTECFC